MWPYCLLHSSAGNRVDFPGSKVYDLLSVSHCFPRNAGSDQVPYHKITGLNPHHLSLLLLSLNIAMCTSKKVICPVDREINTDAGNLVLLSSISANIPSNFFSPGLSSFVKQKR